MRALIAITVLILILQASGCTATEAQLNAHATHVAEEVVGQVFATLTATAGGDSDPGPAAATPAHATRQPAQSLEPADIYHRVASSVAYIEPVTGSGSGVLIRDLDGTRYVLTNAHVLWPYESARVVFPDGQAFPDLPLFDQDLMGDIALLGPVETDLPSLALIDREDLQIGHSVYLIGYPGEAQTHPQPALSHGLISLHRQWPAEAISYFQTDAQTAGGQSGGVLVSDRGEVIGISGFIFAGTFTLVASAADMLPRVEALLHGQDVDQLGDRQMPVREHRFRQRYAPANAYDNQLLVFDLAPGDELEVTATSSQDVILSLLDNFGESISVTDESESGSETFTVQMDIDGPQYLVVEHAGDDDSIRISTNQPFAVFEDPDDGQELILDSSTAASLDYPLDSDVFHLLLEAGQGVEVVVDSTMIDGFLIMAAADRPDMTEEYDDDSGGGLFGLNARLHYIAPVDGEYLVAVQDSTGREVGGYWITVRELEE